MTSRAALIIAAMAAAQQCDDVKVFEYSLQMRDGATIGARAYAPGDGGVEKREPTAAERRADAKGVSSACAEERSRG